MTIGAILDQVMYVDTSVLIDYLRGKAGAADLLERARASGILHASEITRLEVLAGMRVQEEAPTRLMFSTLAWHDVDAVVAEQAGVPGGNGYQAIRVSTEPTWRSPRLRS